MFKQWQRQLVVGILLLMPFKAMAFWEFAYLDFSYFLSPPAVPTVTVSEPNSTDGNWTVSWSASSGATMYRLEESAGGDWDEIYYGSATRFNVSNQTVSGSYHYRVQACAVVCSTYSTAKEVKLDYIKPSSLSGIPSNTGTATGRFTVSWFIPADAGIAATYQAKLQRRLDSGSWQDITSLSKTTSSFQNNLAPGTYEYRLIRNSNRYFCYYSACGHISTDFTETAKSITVAKPGIPSSIAVSTSSATALTVSWGAAGGNPSSGYHVVHSKNNGGYTDLYKGTSRSRTVAVVPASYRYQVRSCRGGWTDSHCSAWRVSDLKQITMGAASRPSISNKSSLSDTVLTVSWPAVTHATVYKLYKQQAAYGSSSYTTGLVYSGSARAITQTLPEGNYRYKVTACHQNICGGTSATVSTQVLLKPSTPSNLRISNKTGQTDKAYTVTWNSQSRRVTSYKLYRDKAAFGSASFQAEATTTTTARSINKTDGDGEYRYRVQACNEAGCSALSSPITAVVLSVPTVPTKLGLINQQGLSDGSYTLRWDGASGRVSGYEVFRATAAYNGSFGGEAKTVSSAVSLNYTDGDGKYRYRIRACNESGCSAYTAYKEVQVLAKPLTPAGLAIADKASDVDASYRLVWHSQSRRVTEYRLHRERRTIGSTSYTANGSQTTTARAIAKSDADGDYRYRIQACNEAGCSDLSGAVSTRVLATPSTPSNLRITNQSNAADTRYSVVWDTQSTRVSHYQLYRDQATYGSSHYRADTTTSPTAASVNKTDNDGHYRYRVAACNESGCSSPSATVNVTVLSLPAVPGEPTVPSNSLGAFNASLSYGSGIVHSVQLQQSVNDGAWLNADVASYDGKPASLPLMRSAYVNNTSGQLARYRFRIAACNHHNNYSGCSAYSAPSNRISVVPPGTPAGFVTDASHGSADSDGNFSLQWQALPNVVTGGVSLTPRYELQRSADAGASWQVLANTITAANYAQSGISVGDYQYRLRACLATVGCGDWSHSLALKVAYTPAQVSSLNAPATSSSGHYVLSWSQPSGVVTHYQLERNNRLDPTAITTTTVTESEVADGSIAYRVRACNASVCTAMSAVQTTQVLLTPSQPRNMGGNTSSDASGHYWLRWDRPGQGRVDFYQLKTSTAPTDSWATALNNGQQRERSFSKADGSYHYQVRACNQFNDNTLNCGPATAIHQVTVLNLPTVVAPSVPSQSLNGSYTLAWQQPSARVDYYRVLENGVLIAGVHNGLSLPLSARADGDYHYQVSACNSAGCSNYSPEASIRVLQTPSAVKHLQGDAVSNGAGAFQLHWQQPDRGQILRYEIRRNLAPNHTWATAINNGLALQRDFSQTEEGDYRYEVRACNALSCGSVQAHTVMVRIAPVSPSNINGIGVSTSGDYSLTWGSGSGTITAYELQQAKDELPAADDLDWQPLQRAHTTHYSVAGQTAGRYAYRVRACNDNNCGAWSALKVVEVDRHTVPLAPAPSAATAPQHPASSDTIGSTAGQFRVSESGAATYTVPISVAAGTAGVAPELSLSYSSQGGNGLLGKGWTLSGLGSIVRCRQSAIQDGQAKAITWSSDDRYCLDGQRLVLVSGSHYGAVGSVYKTEIDTFAQITATGGSAGHPDYFVVSRKDGSTARFGASDDAKQQKGADRTYVWALNHFEDSVGNGIDFSYSNDADGHRIDSIRYAYGRGATAHAQVRFQYETRADILQAYVAGEHFVTRQRMVGIQTYSRHNGESVLLREYRLRYHSNEATGDHLDNADHRRDAALELSRLAGITECTDNAICLPETAFNWRAASTAFGIHSDASESGVLNFNGNNYLIDSKFTDINGDGLQDLVFVSGRVKLKKRFLRRPRLRSHQNVHYLMNTGSGFVHGDSTYYNDDIRNPLKLQVLDYNGDSHQDLLVYREQGGWELYLATASGGGHWSLEKTALTLPFSGRDIQLADLNADGLVDAFDGNRFWLLERDPAQAASANRAYRFGAGQAISYRADTSSANPAVSSITHAVKATAGDINGDGVSDFLIQRTVYEYSYDDDESENGDGYNNEIIAARAYQFALSDYRNGELTFTTITDNAPPLSEHELTRFVDVNADGLSDVIYWSLPHRQWQLQLSTGTGFTAATALVSATGGAMAEDQAVQFADINRDGYSDFLWLDEGQLKVKYWRASSQHYSDGHRLKYVGTGDKNSTIVMDYNGDGAADYVRFFGSGNGGRFGYASSGDEASGLWDAKRNVNHVVDRIQTGLGGITALHYEHLNQSEHYAPIEPAVSSCVWRCSDVVGNTYHNDHSVYNDPFGDIAADAHGLQAQPLAPVLALNGAIPVVSRVSSSAPTATDSAAQSSIAYYYAGGRIQAGGRGNLGFKQLRTVDQQTGVATTTTYRQDWPFIGKPSSTEVHSADAKLLSQATNRWALQGWQTQWIDTAKAQGTIALGALQPYVANSHEQGYALVNNGQQQGELLQSVTTELQYDAFGNALQILSRTEDGSGTEVQRQTTTNAYGSSDYDQRMGRLSATTVVTERAGQASPTRVSHFSYYQSGDLKGLLHTETLQPDAGAAQTLSTQHHYDANGNSTHTTTQGWDGQAVVTRPSSRIEYEASGRYVARSYQTYLNHGEVLTSQVVTRNAYGSATVAADTLGNRAYTYYSPMGRAYFTSSDAGGWQHTWLSQADSQCPGGSAYVSQTQGADGSHRQRCRDVLGRTTRSLSRGFDGQWLASDVHYDHLGRTVATSEAYKLAHGHSGYWTTIDNYDLLGRPTRITAPDGSVSQQQYQGLNTTHINALGHRKTETHNVLGELVAVRDNAGNSTHYQHDALGHLTQMTSSAGHITTLLYDALGRKTGMQDPDKGQWHYQHNAFGELIEQGDAKGQISRLQYDSLGRQQQRIDLNSDGSTAQSTQWHYDSQPNGIGQLAWVAHSDGYQQQQYYDNFGRNTRSDTTVPQAGTFSQRQTFDHLGRSYQQFDASSNQQANGQRGLQTHYNAYGYAYQVSDVRYQQGQPLTVYHRITQMDARGNVTASSLGNGVHTTHDYNIATGLLESINSLRLDGIVVQDLQYNWDSVGNLRHRIDHSGTKNLEEHFSYDGMNRLIAASVHSDNPYTQSLQYDALGNITEKSTVGYYHYGSGNTGTGTAGPHAVTKAGDTTYQYDANGNNISSSDGRRLAYSSFDKVILVSNGSHSTRFAYGPSRNRYLRSDSNSQSGSSKTTYYLGNVERIDYHSGPRAGEREYKRQLGVAIETLLYQHGELQQQTTHYLHHDHLGSIDLITDRLGQVVETLSFDPWGQRRHGGNWDALDHNALTAFSSAITTRGFTGHEMVDGVGIIHMNGRIYDPKLARFLQADPFIQAPTNSQSLNRYSYTINNPLNKTDPSGYFSVKDAFKVLAVIVISFATYGAASGWAMGAAMQSSSFMLSYGLAGASTLAGAVGGAVAGFAAGVSAAAFSGASGFDALKAGFRGAFAGGITGGIAGHFRNTYSVSRIAADGVGMGIGAEINGGKFKDGLKFGLAVSLATYANVKLREYQLKHSKGTPGQVGDSPGFRGVKGKVGGGRIVDKYWKESGAADIYKRTGDAQKALATYYAHPGLKASPLGGHQGGQGIIFSDKLSYPPRGFFDYMVEGFAGTHDSLNHWYHYNPNGTAIGRDGFSYWFGEGINAANVVIATPVVAPSLIPDYMRFTFYNELRGD